MRLFAGTVRMDQVAMILDFWRFRENVQIVESASDWKDAIRIAVLPLAVIQIKNGRIVVSQFYKYKIGGCCYEIN